jgi:hypothetical protein
MYSYDKNGKRIDHSEQKVRENYTQMTFTSSSSASSGGKHHWIFIVIGVITAIILLGVIYYVYFKSKRSENFSTSTSQPMTSSTSTSQPIMGMRKSTGFQWFKYPKRR